MLCRSTLRRHVALSQPTVALSLLEIPTRSVSNDNPFSESLFKTLKYCPQYPSNPFESIEAARAWVSAFVRWYNTVHLHSAIGFTTPDSRHQGKDIEILAKRKDVFEAAKQRHPNRLQAKQEIARE